MASSELGNSIRLVGAAFLRGKWVFSSILLSTLVVVSAYVTLSPRIFRASSTLIVEHESQREDLRGLSMNQGDQDILVELEVLKSMDLATRVAEQLDGYRTGEQSELYPLLDGFESTAPGRLLLAKSLKKQIEIDQVRRDIGVIELAFRSRNPSEAQLVTNLYASEYASRNLESSRVRASGLRSFVEAQLTDHQDKLDGLERQLAEFQESENAFALDEEARRLSQQMADLQTLLDQAHVESEMVTAQLGSLNDEYAKIEPNLAARVSAAGLEKEIATLQEEIAQLEFDIERKYAKNPSLHGNESTDPGLTNLIAQTEALKAQVRKKADRYVSGVMSSGGVDPERGASQAAIPATLAYVSSLRREITDKKITSAALQARVEVLSRRIRKYERDFERIPAQARTIAALQRDRGSSEQMFAWLTEKYEEARIAEESEFGSVRILDAAYLPTDPVAPRSLYALVLGGLLGLVLAVAGVFVRELLDESVVSPDRIRELGIPLLGVVPLLRTRRGRSAGNVDTELVVVSMPQSRAATSIQHLVTKLDAEESSVCNVTLVTSPRTGEGKTTVAANISAGLAAAGHRTLLLDGNVWRPGVHDLLGVEQAPGLMGLLFGATLMKDAVQPTVIPNLSVIGAGAKHGDQFTLLASRDFDALMTYLKASFDRIVIDSPGIHSDGSSLGLLSLCDSLALVVRSGVTSESELEDCVAELTNDQAPVSVVLNAFDGRKAFGSYSNRRFYGSYGKREPKMTGTSTAGPKQTSWTQTISNFFRSSQKVDLSHSRREIRENRGSVLKNRSPKGLSGTFRRDAARSTDSDIPLWDDSTE